ncbi:uncharacterized protein EAE97_004797 [Botrytis byssoidea]|uniref:Uncharacterized protein n=1 Tax=Botrytis byssoidea TaxID=139641 RepID=A0A9P5IL85_9HELO|nr:uncharacterized protein EAE97_004797 [Botrytis byssoidea]KAF7945759.1 hypothetical protein EAE97_004797 [Botrytis byssoidea]
MVGSDAIPYLITYEESASHAIQETIRDPGRGKPRPVIPRTLQPSCSNSPNLQPAVAAARKAKNT